MLRRMRKLLSRGKKNRSQSARQPWTSKRGRFEVLEDRRMLSVNVLSSVQVGTTGFDQFEDIFSDGSGNVSVSGWSTGAMYGSNIGSFDAVVGKYSASGSSIWTRQFGTTTQDFAYGVVSDASGNVYVTGSTDGSLGGPSLGNRDVFIRKYDSNGNHAWTKQIGTSGLDSGYDIAVDSSGNIYVAGIVSGNFGGTHYGLVDVFVTKYSSSGTTLWTTQLGTGSDDYANSISVDASGNVYVGGYTKGALIGTNAGGTDAFIAKLNGSGSQIWVKQFGASTNDSCESVAVDSSGSLLVSGRSNGVGFISKYNSAGTQLWSNTVNVPISNVRPHGVSVDGGDNVYVGGTVLAAFNGPVSDDAFVAKYNSAGSALWSKIVATTSDEDGLALSVNALGNIYIGGKTGGSLAAPQLGNGDAFFSRIVDTSFTINTTSDTVDANPGDGAARDSSGNTSLRAAIQEANALGVSTRIVLPAGTYNLTITGSGGDSQGDLDITGYITIVGAGAGSTIINASALSDRVFDIASSGILDISQVTITGGYLSSASESGAGIQVQSGGNLTIVDSAVVGNNASASSGGGIFRYLNGYATIRRTVFTGNNAGVRGGAIRTNGTSGILTVETSVFGNNTAGTEGSDVFLSGNTNNLGNNLIEDNSFDNGFFQTSRGDYIGSVDYVVTDLVDTLNHTDDATVRSLRDALDSADTTSGAQTIWLPAWHFKLTAGGGGNTQGDLDVTTVVTVRGTGPGRTIVDASTLSTRDRVFDVATGGTLDISRVTVTGGYLTGSSDSGAGLQVQDGGNLTITDSAVVGNNTTSASGGGIFRYLTGNATVIRTVFTGNNAGVRGGAIRTNGAGGVLSVEASVFADNTAGVEGPNVFLSGSLTNLGFNMIDDTSGSTGFFSASSPMFDYIGAVDHVVTSLADEIDSSNDQYAFTLREAVILSNGTAPNEVVWLAPWLVRLVIEGAGGAESGDLDIADNLTIRGIDNGTVGSLVDSLSIVDAAFDNLGLLTLVNVDTI